MAFISLVEYARKNGKSRTTVYKKYAHGGFKTAMKCGRDIIIDEDEPYINYVPWQRKNEIKAEGEGKTKDN